MSGIVSSARLSTSTLSKTMLCIIDLCDDEETVVVGVSEEQKAEAIPAQPQFIPMPSLQIVPVENDES